MQSAPFLQKMIRWNASKNHPTRAFKNQYFYWSVVFFTHMHCIRNELQFNLKFCLHNSDIVWGITTDTFIVLQNRHPPSPSCWSAWFFVWLCIFFVQFIAITASRWKQKLEFSKRIDTCGMRALSQTHVVYECALRTCAECSHVFECIKARSTTNAGSVIQL